MSCAVCAKGPRERKPGNQCTIIVTFGGTNNDRLSAYNPPSLLLGIRTD